MKAGALRHRVKLQTLTAGQDDIGQPVTAWADTATVWADVRHLSGLSAIKSGADVSLTKASIRMRYRAANAGQRVVYGSEVFDVQSVLPDGKKSYIDLVCEVAS